MQVNENEIVNLRTHGAAHLGKCNSMHIMSREHLAGDGFLPVTGA
jgi:hypothetical protein